MTEAEMGCAAVGPGLPLATGMLSESDSTDSASSTCESVWFTDTEARGSVPEAGADNGAMSEDAVELSCPRLVFVLQFALSS